MLTYMSTKIGSPELAETVAREFFQRYNPLAEEGDNVVQIPGFEYLGEGYSRVAYLGPDGNVYKVPMYEVAEMDNANEHRTLRVFQEESWAPEVELYRVVVAERWRDTLMLWRGEGEIPIVCMEYIEDDGTALSQKGQYMMDTIPVKDIGADLNIKIRAGLPIVIDAGMGERSEDE